MMQAAMIFSQYHELCMILYDAILNYGFMGIYCCNTIFSWEVFFQTHPSGVV